MEDPTPKIHTGATCNTHFNGIKTDIDLCYGFNADVIATQLMQVAEKICTNSKKMGE